MTECTGWSSVNDDVSSKYLLYGSCYSIQITTVLSLHSILLSAYQNFSSTFCNLSSDLYRPVFFRRCLVGFF